jgi:DnaJ-class molecular chaperone
MAEPGEREWEACSVCDGSGWGECSCESNYGHDPRFCDASPCASCDGTGDSRVQEILIEDRMWAALGEGS